MPFHPFYTAKDGWFAAALPDCSTRSSPSSRPTISATRTITFRPTRWRRPAHIVPEWYFWPFYAILRSFTVDFILPAKLWGVLAMFTSILLLFFLPWLDKSPVRSGSYRPVFKRFFWLLVIDVIVLGYVGGAADQRRSTSRSARSPSAYYFLHFLVILPLVSKFETPAAAAAIRSANPCFTARAAEAAPAGQGAGRGSVATAG